MNQMEMNQLARYVVETQSVEVCNKLQDVLVEDLKQRGSQIGGPVTHYVHNTALFHTLLALNCLLREQNSSREALQEYLEYAQTLLPKFLDIVEALKDFEPTGRPPTQEEENAK
jgi:hypothetical protein